MQNISNSKADIRPLQFKTGCHAQALALASPTLVSQTPSASHPVHPVQIHATLSKSIYTPAPRWHGDDSRATTVPAPSTTWHPLHATYACHIHVPRVILPFPHQSAVAGLTWCPSPELPSTSSSLLYFQFPRQHLSVSPEASPDLHQLWHFNTISIQFPYVF